MAENECILINASEKLQMARSRFQNFVCLDFRWHPLSCTLLTGKNMTSLQFGVISSCKFFTDYKLHLPNGFVQFCSLWKIYSCQLTPNFTWSHVLTYTKNLIHYLGVKSAKIEEFFLWQSDAHQRWLHCKTFSVSTQVDIVSCSWGLCGLDIMVMFKRTSSHTITVLGQLFTRQPVGLRFSP